MSQTTASGNEAPVVARRRHHTCSYKLKVLAQADRCTQQGELVALALREGLYAFTLNREKSGENACGQEKPHRNSGRNRIHKLAQAEWLLELPKKVAALLESLSRDEPNGGGITSVPRYFCPSARSRWAPADAVCGYAQAKDITGALRHLYRYLL
ncbi:MAG: hypothetical protein LBN38_06945 [Verrucomicrobiota bacterium]|nr:hypothetical protein [Verrucomicrobiota bacterium]